MSVTGFILPLAEFVTEFKHLEPVLCFYDNGLKGLIKEIVLRNTAADASGQRSEALVKEIVTSYEHSMHVRYMENTLKVTDPSIYIELFVIQLDELLAELLLLLFSQSLQTHRWDYNDSAWIGNDLLVRMVPIDSKPNSSHRI